MAHVTLAAFGAPTVAAYVDQLSAAIEIVGHEIGGTLAAPTDVIVTVTDARSAEPDIANWLWLANQATHTLAIGLDHRPEAPANIRVRADRVASGWPVAPMVDLIDQLASEIPSIAPIIVEVPDATSTSPFVGREFDDTKALLCDPQVRALGVTSSARHLSIGSRPATPTEYRISRLLLRTTVRPRVIPARMRVGSADLVTETTSLVDLFDDQRFGSLFVLRGQPQIGKTTQLGVTEAELNARELRHPAADDRMVLGVNIGSQSLAPTDPSEWMDAAWESVVRKRYLGSLSGLADAGRLVLLLDGLDEALIATDGARRKWAATWKAHLHRVLTNPSNRVVIACRRRDLMTTFGTDLRPQTDVLMIPLDADAVVQLAGRVGTNAARMLSRSLDADPTLIHLYNTPMPVCDVALARDDEAPAHMSAVHTTRFRASILREFDRFGERAATLLPQGVIADLRDVRDPAEWPGILLAIAVFSVFASIAAEGLVDSASPQPGVAAAFSRRGLPAVLAGHGIPEPHVAIELALAIGILRHDDDGYRYAHRTVHEWLASLVIEPDDIIKRVELTHGGFDAELGPLDEVLATPSGRERQVVRPSTGVEEVMCRMLERDPSLLAALVEAHPWLCLDEVITYPTRVAPAERRALLISLRDELDRRAQSSDLRERFIALDARAVACSTLRALDGDSTPQLPDLVMIPAAKWNLRPSDAGLKAPASRRGTHQAELPGFSIGRTPVTNDQYASFVGAGGYENEDLWTSEGWAWRSGRSSPNALIADWLRRRAQVVSRPELPTRLLASGLISVLEAAATIRFATLTDEEVRDLVTVEMTKAWTGPAFADHPELGLPGRPVVGVCIHEAKAYCEWLSRIFGRVVRLPREVEWQAAEVFSESGGPRRRLGPLDDAAGNDPRTANTLELRLGTTSPVGTLVDPLDDPPLLVDMRGSTFDWCADLYAPGEQAPLHLMKGGSWRHLRRRSDLAYRGRGHTTLRNDDVGFRILVETT